MYYFNHLEKVSLSFQEGDDINEEIVKLPVTAPCIMVMESSETTTYDVVVEESSLVQSTDINTALVDLFSAYFVFDIEYPPELRPILIFIQHYVFVWFNGSTEGLGFCNNHCHYPASS